MLRPEDIASVIEAMIARRLAPGVATVSATVVRTGTTSVDIQLATGEIVNRVPIIGAASAGDLVAIKHEQGRYIAAGTKTANSEAGVSAQGTFITSGGSAVGGIYASGNLIVLDVISLPGSTLISVDATKLGITGGRFSKIGAGALTLQSAPTAANIYFPTSGTAAMGAGLLSVTSINAPTSVDHTHAIVTSSLPQAQTIVAADVNGRIGVAGLGIGGAGVV